MLNHLKRVSLKEYEMMHVGLMLAIFSYLWVMVSLIQDIINFQYVLATAKVACGRINSIYAKTSNNALKLSTIRKNIHLILQHPKLFNDTMLFNLTLAEAYSNEKVQEALSIAHRLSTIKSAEFIYVLEDGKVIDSGTPHALLAKDEIYFS